MAVKKVEPRKLYIIDPMDFDGDCTEFIECPGNDTLEWYWLSEEKERDLFDQWIRDQLPKNFKDGRVLLEWCW